MSVIMSVMTDKKKRRRKGEGGVWKLSNYNGGEGWCASWIDKDGVERRARALTEQGAIERRNKRRNDEAAGRMKPARPKKPDKNNPTLSMFIDSYIESGTTAADESKRKYKNNLEKWVVPYIGRKLIKKITTSDCEDWKNACMNDGIGASALWHVHKILSAVFGYAIKKGLIKYNPLNPVVVPKKPNDRAEYIDRNINKHLQILDGLLAWIKNDEKWCSYEPFVLCLMLGMRREEILGLTAESIDEKSNQLKISTKLKQIKGGGYKLVDGTKNGRGRVIPIWIKRGDVVIVDFISLLRNAKNAVENDGVEVPIYSKTDKIIDKDKLIFVNKDGSNWSYTQFNTIWRSIQNAYLQYCLADSNAVVSLEEQTYIYPHEMRHLFASKLASSGVSIAVAKSLLGHLTPAMTEHYTHISDEGKIKAMGLFGEDLSGDVRVAGEVGAIVHEANAMNNASIAPVRPVLIG